MPQLVWSAGIGLALAQAPLTNSSRFWHALAAGPSSLISNAGVFAAVVGGAAGAAMAADAGALSASEVRLQPGRATSRARARVEVLSKGMSGIGEEMDAEHKRTRPCERRD